MNRCITLALSLGLLLVTSVSLAQEPPSMPAPEKEHLWLKKFTGQWNTQCEATMAPGLPPMQCVGTLSSRALGDYWVLNEMTSKVQDVSVTGMQTIGYDPKTKKFVGTWVDSMTSHLWRYEGTLNEDGTTLTLEAEGPNMMAEGKMATYHDVYEFKSDDEMSIASKIQGDDGKWVTFMSGTATRKK